MPKKQETAAERRARLDKKNATAAAKRAAETEEERETRLEKDRESKRSRKANQSDAEASERRSLLATQKRNRIANLSDTEASERRSLLATQKRNRVANLSDAEASERRSLLATQERNRVDNLPDAEASERKTLRATQKRNRDANLSDAEASERRSLHANQERNRFDHLSADRRQVRAAENRQNHSLRVDRQRSALLNQTESYIENENNVLQHTCGDLTLVCQACQSLNFKDEIPDNIGSRCCGKGKINPPPLRAYPDNLRSLLTMQDPLSKNFRTNIRSINNSFAFASMGANFAKLPPGGPFTFRIQGQIYHRTGTLHPNDGEERQYAQLYVLDPAEATEQRMKHPSNAECNPDLMRRIAFIMQDLNEFAKSYRMLHEIVEEAAESGFDDTITMAIKNDRQADPRRYNEPTVSEVAIVFDNFDGEPPFHRDILIHPRYDVHHPNANKMKRISILDPNLDAMTYPLLFPFGEQGWGTDLSRQGGGQRTRMSQMEFYGHRLSVREELNPILHAGRLTQQYIVDAYVKMEANRLNYLRMNQPKLRVDKYNGFVDHIHGDDNTQPGKAIILPSTFEGSPRNYQQRYQDAMAMVTKFGKPDFFITMTCNPKWPEILNNIESWERPEDRPDIVSRVFNLKKNALLKDLETGLFGKLQSLIHVIEFQKRGLPHAHILLTVVPENKLKDDSEIDKFVNAEIPSEEYPILRERVLKHMVHGPCGKGNKNSPCMQNDQCSKNFPKKFQAATIGNVNGYPLYRRKEGPYVEVNTKQINNQWIVPYNPYLILKYNCHINVEVCASIKSVKYLFKYVYKGHDAAQVNVSKRDELLDFVDGRYVSAPEAVWRIFGFPMHKQSHSIMRLDVHLQNEQAVYFDPEVAQQNPDAALQNADRKQSTLQAWFNLNITDAEARNLFYWEIPDKYWFDKNKVDSQKRKLPYQWVKRVRNTHNTIGRMYSVAISDPERYYLRILLLHVKGATSWTDLLTVNGVQCETFRESARLRGYLIDDKIWEDTLEDASVFQMPYHLRQMFAYICLFCSPAQPAKLWTKFLPQFLEDVCHKRHPGTNECLNCEQYALKDVQNVYLTHGKSWSHLQLPFPPTDFGSNESEYDIENEILLGSEMHFSLNAQQREAFDEIMKAVNDDSISEKCFFLDGPGGTGKTYLYNTLMHCIRGNGGVVLPVATTGVAANLLIGGKTMHSQYGLPLDLNECSVSRFTAKTDEGKSIINAKLLLIDECTMAASNAVNTIDNLLRELMSTKDVRFKYVPFGGKPILFGGDFRQCLAVIPHGKPAEIVQNSIKYCKAWPKFKRFTLINNLRSEDPNFSEWLLQLGDGTLTNQEGFNPDIIEIPNEFVTEENLVTEIYGQDINDQDFRDLANRAILTPLNKTVDKVNDEIISKLNGQMMIYYSTDEANCDDPADATNFPLEFMNTLTPSGMPPHALKLKLNTIVILLRNLDTKRGLCNGTRLLIRELKRNVIIAEILTGSGKGNVELIPRIILDSTRSSDIPFQLRRRQFPVKPAFAMTINKAQGQTLDKVGILLPEPIFGHGQLYVAFSRAKKACNVRVKIFDSPFQGKLINGSDKVFTRNIVYREVL